MSSVNYLPQVFFSNRLEVLYQELKTGLFKNSHPFTRRMIIVSSPAIKSWLMLQMAQDPELGIAAGIEICFVDPAMNRLSQLLSSDQQKQLDCFCFEPSEMEVSFALEQEMLKAIDHFDSFSLEAQDIWKPLLNYLNIGSSNLIITTRIRKRITALSNQLARYFLEYGKLGGKIIEKWINTPAVGWQQALWQRLESLYRDWNYPYRKFETFAIGQIPEAGDLQVHIFGLSYLAPVHHRFLMKLGQHFLLNYYLISPCQKFWTDLLSDKEGIRLKAYWQKRGIGKEQQNDLAGYLRDNNPLLANFGKLGREMTQQIEESHLITVEKYALPASVLECESYDDLIDDELLFYETPYALTMLEAVQSDIALLRNPEEYEKIDFSEYDGTIQVHAAAKPMREVEAVYNAIMGILDKHQDEENPVFSSDVIVMSPDIAEYAPFIRSVFGAPDSALDYHIMDLEIPVQNLFIQAFLHLLHLPLCRWDAASLLRLFDHQAFQLRHKLTREDVQMVRKWIKVAKIRWGKDQHHRNELLMRDHCSKEMFDSNGEGTWDHGLGRLLEGLAMISGVGTAEEAEGHYQPIERVESTQGELLGKVIHLLRSLLEDLRPLNDGTQLTIKEWTFYLKCLCESYFEAGLEEEEEGYHELINQFNTFEKVSSQLTSATFAFHSIQSQLEQSLNKKSVNHRETHVQAIRFCSMLPMRSIPAKVVVLMGMNEDAFPRMSEQAKLNCLLHNSEADYYPTQMDFDRYLFLEAVLSARRYLIFSYVSQAKNDTKELLPSLLITELMNYLDKAYRIPGGKVSQSCTIHHAFLAFEKRYFEEGYSQKSYRQSHFAAARSLYQSEKVMPHHFMSNFDSRLPSKKEESSDLIIDLIELMAFARNPLKIYFNKSLGIYLEKEEDRIMLCDEEWLLSHLDDAMISRGAIFSDIPNPLIRAEKFGRLPAGPFREMGTEKIKKDAEVLGSNLMSYKVDGRDVFSIEFSERFSIPTLTGSCWEMPALSLITPQGLHVTLAGRLENVSHQGLVFFGEDKIKDALKAWPSVLVLCSLIKSFQLPIIPALLFIKGKASPAKIAEFDDPYRLLGQYVDYFWEGKQNPCPLLPEWVAPILNGDSEELQTILSKNNDDTFQPIYDDYLKWMGRNAANIDAAGIIGIWQTKAQKLFMDLFQAWYPNALKVDV